MQIAVLVDNSQAALHHIRDLRVGVEGFVTEMLNGTKHQISITGWPSGRRFSPTLVRSREGHQGRQPHLRTGRQRHEISSTGSSKRVRGSRSEAQRR
jgi:hypothetical protein